MCVRVGGRPHHPCAQPHGDKYVQQRAARYVESVRCVQQPERLGKQRGIHGHAEVVEDGVSHVHGELHASSTEDEMLSVPVRK